MNTDTKRAEILKYLCLGVSYAFSYAYVNIFDKFHSRLYTPIYLTLLAIGALVWLEAPIGLTRLAVCTELACIQ